MTMEYHAQVTKDHYHRNSYASSERWLSYWYQMDLVRATRARTVLEIGPGNGVVTRELRREGISVTTCDIARDLEPDVVGSVTDLPLADHSYDAILIAEVLEHIHFDDVPKALAELARVACTHVVISVPHPGYVFALNFKVPLLPRVDICFRIPFFWETHVFNGQHYWELGKRGYSVRRFVQMAREAGFVLVSSRIYAFDPAHRFFLFKVHTSL